MDWEQGPTTAAAVDPRPTTSAADVRPPRSGPCLPSAYGRSQTRMAQLAATGRQTDLIRTTSSPEAGNAAPQLRRGAFPRFGSATFEELRSMMAHGDLPGGLGGGEPLPQQSLARQAAGAAAAVDPLGWRRGLQQAAAAPDAPHMADLRSTARALEAEISEGMTRRLCNAAAALDLGVVAALVQAGADVACQDTRSRTPLHTVAMAAADDAAAERAAPILRILLARGADVSARDADGATPLHLAAGSAIARMLLAAAHGSPTAPAARSPAACVNRGNSTCRTGGSGLIHQSRRLGHCAPPVPAATATAAAAASAAASAALAAADAAAGTGKAPDGSRKAGCPPPVPLKALKASPLTSVTAAAAAVASQVGKRQRLEDVWLQKAAPRTPPRQPPPRPPAALNSARQGFGDLPPQPQSSPLLQGGAGWAAGPKLPPVNPDAPAPIRASASRARPPTPAFQMCGGAAAMQSLASLADMSAGPFCNTYPNNYVRVAQ